MGKEPTIQRVLLTGATGFVGSALYPALIDAGFDVVCATRSPERARRKQPEKTWVGLDVEDDASVRRAMEGCDAAYYLVHRMSDAEDYEARETSAAMNFLEAATRAGVRRIVYLGGVKPRREPSRHLRSRLVTGAILRSGDVSTIELRASMIIGAGSASWRLLRDISVRLPLMLCPRWLRNRTEPVAIEDVVRALVAALTLRHEGSASFDIPGPEVVTFQECVRRVAEAVGNDPVMVNVPLLTPHLSTYWLRLVTGTNVHLARELVEGLKSDLLARDARFWELVGVDDLVSIDEAIARALAEGPSTGNTYERAIKRVYRDPHASA
ncbi:NAD-dependent epimerase/dehydratase family protein [Bradymonadaceae bacterium TMQ3]|nr:NAD-dependent epimerase/dehydratase family protein [Bradymonadaceae bacterium TMQ3]TXC76474.1 NAD-dependent epimerase/dehydratase family protein [Bradymonadales bacterium TMQ1]